MRGSFRFGEGFSLFECGCGNSRGAEGAHLRIVTDIGVHSRDIGLFAEFILRVSSLDCALVIAAEWRVCNFDAGKRVLRRACPVLSVQTEKIDGCTSQLAVLATELRPEI